MGQPLPDGASTLLTLSFMDIPPYSARGLKQSIGPISMAGQLARDWNGALLDLSNPNFRKYQTRISGNDQAPPAIDGIWPGLQVTIGCLQELSYKTGMAGAPNRPPVAGSSRVEGAFTFYRPQLVCRITGFDVDEDEYGAQIGWSLEAEEV
jgi:hypothetical protein